ncbi:tetratricopeptide repeat protein [Psychrobacter sp. B38]|uniref:tetratricopeptide repeat protein n=1 Tax=Psychrobacter sp. B38 TaxID=3143538 RepID=UPI00320CEE86
MMSPLQQMASSKRAIVMHIRQNKPANTLLVGSALVTMLSLSACQTTPSMSTAAQTTTQAPAQTTAPTTTVQSTTVPRTPSSQTPKGTVDTTTVTTVTQAPIVRTDNDSDYAIESDDVSEPSNPLTQETPIFNTPSSTPTQADTVILIPSRDDYMISEPSAPSRNELLEQARKNSQQRTQKTSSNNSDLPAFRNLMQAGINQLKAGNLTSAENSFTRAQRLAPKSSAVYFYLAQVALKKNQPRKAEAMARRGLSVSQDSSRRRALWQIILQSGQAQGNSRVVSEAKSALR